MHQDENFTKKTDRGVHNWNTRAKKRFVVLIRIGLHYVVNDCNVQRQWSSLLSLRIFTLILAFTAVLWHYL